ncbi:Pilin accessory protein (PilO) [Maridesulfovibrio ferrireducens]|uniref:Pilin accessory protein (PilO) n=1 Tax=Maridesulfovibrio ferrireducens TaxID=246191 RepID=A0A1G9ENP1_9BACT|nr:type 4b pilus protein PilO2 [Maridesulfovibrio ferrireducens]SDK77671.1 Pilin accessory protein (PilO) [Maridesulfovibrio ferrireducens]
MHTIRIKKKQYAVGFWWQILDGKGGKKLLMEQARKVATDFSDREYNYVIARKQQFGLSSDSAKLNRIPSLACALVERSRSTWIGMFCLSDEENLWWVCAVSKKTIVAEGDQFFNSREETEAHLKSLKTMSDWEKNEFICETFGDTLKHFDGLIKPSERVQPLYPQKNNGKLLILAAAVVLTVAGFIFWNDYQADQLAEQQRIAAIKARTEAEKNKANFNSDPGKYFTMPWKISPMPLKFAEPFLKAMRNTEPFNNGWKLETITRNDKGIYMAWSHQDGAEFTNRPGNSSFGSRPDLAEINIDYPKGLIRPEQKLINKTDATAHLYELTRTLGAKLNLTWKSPEIKKKNNKFLNKPFEIIAPWIKGEWKLSGLPAGSAISDFLFIQMDSIPCLVISEISFTRNQCSMEGQIYAKY